MRDLLRIVDCLHFILQTQKQQSLFPSRNCIRILLRRESKSVTWILLRQGVTHHFLEMELIRRPAVGKAEAKRATPKPAKEDAKIEGAALIGIDVRKDLDFPTWYAQVLTKGDMVSSLSLHS